MTPINVDQSVGDNSNDVADDGIYSVADTINARADESEFRNIEALKAAAALKKDGPTSNPKCEDDPDHSNGSGDAFNDNPSQ